MRIKIMILSVWVLLASTFANDADPVGELNNYSLFGAEALVVNGTAGTVNDGWIGSNGDVDFSRWQGAVTFRGSIKTRGDLNLETESPGRHVIARASYVMGNVTGSVVTLDTTGSNTKGSVDLSEPNIYYKGTSTVTNVTGTGSIISDPSLEVDSLGFTAYTALTASSENCTYNNKWTCTGATGALAVGDTLPAGDYAAVNVTAGTALFGSGIYKMQSYNSPGGTNTLVKHGTEVVRFIITDSFNLGGGAGQFFRSNDSTTAADTAFAGRLLVRVEGSTANAVKFVGGGTVFHGTLMAPNATVVMKSEMKLYGQVFAKRIELDNNFDGSLGRFVTLTGGTVTKTPVLSTSVNDTTVIVGDTTKLNVNQNFTDPDGDTLVYTAVSLNNKVDLVITDSIVNIIGKVGQTGVDTVIISAFDGVYTIKDTIEVTLLSGLATKNGDLGVAITKLEDFADTVDFKLDTIFDGATSYSVTNTDSTVNAQIVSGHLEVTSLLDSNGVDTLIVAGTNASGSIYDTLIINLTAVNDSVRVVGVGIQDTTVSINPQTVIEIGNKFVDPEGDAIVYAVHDVLGNKINASIVAPDSLVMTAKADSTGIDTVIVSATSDGKVTFDTLVVTLGSTAPYKSGDLGAQIEKDEDFADSIKINLLNVFTGADSFNITQIGSTVSINAATNTVITSLPDSNGLATIIIEAFNSQGSVKDTLLVNVSAVDDDPVVNGTGIQDTTATNKENTDIVVGNKITDVDGDVITYAIDSIYAGKVTAVVVAPDTIRIKALDGVTGFDTVVVSATANGKVVYDTLVITLGDTSPEKTGGLGTDSTQLEDFSDTLTIQLDTAFVGATSYTLTQSDSIVEAKIVSGKLEIVSLLDSNGVDTLIVGATNASGTVYDTLIVTVTAVDDGPRKQGVGIQDTTVTNQENTVIKIGDKIVDPEGDAITYAIDSVFGSKIEASIVAPDSVVMIGKSDSSGVDTVVVSATSNGIISYDTLVVTLGSTSPFKSGDLGTQVNKDEDFTDSIKVNLDSVFVGANSYSVTPADSLVKTEIVNGELIVTSASDSNGTVSLVVTATNNQGDVKDTLTFVVNAVDDGPELVDGTTGIQDTVVNSKENTDIDLGNIIVDIEGDAITFAVDTIFSGKVTAEIVAPDSLRIKAKEGEVGTDTIVVSATSNGLTTYDTLVVTLGNTDPEKVGDLDSLVVDEDFDPERTFDLDSVFKDNNELVYIVTTLQDVVDAEIKDGKLVISAKENQFGLDTVIVTATDTVGEPEKVISDTLYVDIKSVSDELVKKDSLVNIIDRELDVDDTVKVDVDSIVDDKDNVQLKYEVTTTDSIVDVSIDPEGNLEVTRKDGITGVDTVIITITDTTVNPNRVIKDTVVVTVVNNNPELVTDTVTVDSETTIGSEVAVIDTKDADKDSVSISQLNYTADFAIVGNGLVIKQALDKSDGFYVIDLELSDGKTTSLETLVVEIKTSVKGVIPVIGNLPEGSVWDNSQLMVASSEAVEIYSIEGELLVRGEGSSWIDLSNLNSSRLIVKHSEGKYTLLTNLSQGVK